MRQHTQSSLCPPVTFPSPLSPHNITDYLKLRSLLIVRHIPGSATTGGTSVRPQVAPSEA
jgi:hypothetical protein